MSFIRMKDYTGNSSDTKENNQLLIPGCGFEIIPSKLKDPKGSTVFRVLPSFDDNGRETEALDPSGGDEPSILSLGNAFARVSVYNLFYRGLHTFINQVRGDDGEVLSVTKTPQEVAIGRLRYKTWELEQRQVKHLPLTAPSNWIYWRKNALDDPQEQIAVQVSAREIDGQIRRTMKKEPEWVCPAVMLFPSSASKSFLPKFTQKKDPSRPLSPVNNRFGDCITCEKGHLLRLVKYMEEAKGGRTSTLYELLLDDPCPLDAEKISAVVKPWSEILYIPTIPQAIEIIRCIYGDEAADYAFRDTGYYQHVPSQIKGAADSIPDAPSADVIRSLKADAAEKAVRSSSAKPSGNAWGSVGNKSPAPPKAVSNAIEKEEEAESADDGDDLNYGDVAEELVAPPKETTNAFTDQLQARLRARLQENKGK